MQSALHVYVDGGCKGPLLKGSWAFVIINLGKEEIEKVGTHPATTNNRMEITAVLEALKFIKSQKITRAIKITSDSQYVVNGTNEWMHGWAKKGWVKTDGKPVLNQDLWEEMLAMKSTMDVTLSWVKGHSNNEYNQRCDDLCTEAMAAMT